MKIMWGFLTMAVVLSIALLNSCSPAQKAGSYNFLDSFGSGLIIPDNIELKGTPTGKPVFVLDEFNVAGEKRRAIITLGDCKITFAVGPLGQASRLKFSIGMNSNVGDGAEGIITVEADGQSEVVYQRYINPIDRPEDRKWFDESVDLAKFAGKTVKISFGAGRGPKGDATADWFAWSNLVLN